jgi:flagellar basal body-associated protein FliL
MLKRKKSLVGGLTTSLLILMATPAFARSISLKDAGVALWIFIIIGAIIVLLQLIPAIILFFSFIGTTTGLALKKKEAPEKAGAEEKVIVPGYEPAPVKK